MHAIAIVVLAATVVGCAPRVSSSAGSVEPMTVRSGQVALRESMRKLWADHVNRIFVQAMAMADALSDGIVKQFPAKV